MERREDATSQSSYCDDLLDIATLPGKHQAQHDHRENRDTSRGQSDRSAIEDSTEEGFAGSKRLLETNTGTSRLENLPAELRLKILQCTPDLPTLRSLVHASPVLHSQYLHNRDIVLRRCLDRELDGLVIDAYGTIKSRVREIGMRRTNGRITEFLDHYRACLSDTASFPDLSPIAPSNLRWLAAFHQTVARPLSQRYSKWAFRNLQDLTDNTEAFDKDGPFLQRSEEIRIFQAIYRYETYQHLFGRNAGTRVGGFRHHEINEIFFCLFSPWEVEAIGSIDLFVREEYEAIFDKVKDDLHPRNVRFKLENGVFNPEGSFDLIDEHDDYMEGTVSRGLKLAARLLAIDDHQALVAQMERCLTHEQNLDYSLERALESIAQADRREMSTKPPDPKDEAEERGEPLEFTGDTVPPNGPPVAWALLWRGKYANVYGQYVPEPLRRCGYVIWNECRWARMGAKDVVLSQWEKFPTLATEIDIDYDWHPLER